MTSDTYRTGIGVSDLDSITLLGHDLAGDLLGKITFGELAYWLVAKRRPSAGQRASCSKPCSSPSPTMASRRPRSRRGSTLLSAPESIQGALAAGLLGGGSRFLGVTEDAANFLHAAIADLDEIPTDEHGWDAVAGGLVAAARRRVASSPGSVTRSTSRATRARRCMFQLARDNDVYGPHLELFAAVGRAHPAVLGKTLPLNGAGVCGAVLADIDVPLGVVRGVALLARCAGLLGHLAEELDDPIANDVYMNVDRNIDYRPPEP